MSDVIDLSSKRAPTVYTVTIAHHWDGTLEFKIDDVADDGRSREAVMHAFRRICGADAELAAAHGNADDNYKKLIEARAERDTLRALLKGALAHLKTGQWDVPTDIALMARIDAALNKGGGK